MKLYTEEQLRIIYAEGWNDGQQNNIGFIDNAILSLTPIELPSDDEIENACLTQTACLTIIDRSFIKGAEWVIDKIKNQQQ
jgi:hypothetical protein